MEHPFFAWLVGESNSNGNYLGDVRVRKALIKMRGEGLALGVEGGGFGFEDGGGLL